MNFLQYCKTMRKFEKLASLEKKATQPIRMQNSNHLPTKMLPPFGEEGCSANESCRIPVTTKQHFEEEDCSDNKHAGFQSQQNHMLKKKTAQPMSMQDSSHN